jgi:hypothetical protein
MWYARNLIYPVLSFFLYVGSVQAQVRTDRSGTSPDLVSTAALDFLRPYGLENFSEHYIDAFSTLIEAKRLMRRGMHEAADELLDRLWAKYPTGDFQWSQLPTRPFGINLGSPPCYYALRMLTDTVDWHQENPGFVEPARTGRMTVLLVGQSSGIEPRNHQEIKQGSGVFVEHVLEPSLLDDDSDLIRGSLQQFREYVIAMTGGDLGIDIEVVHLPDLEVSVQASVSSGVHFATMTDVSQVWEALDDEVLRDSDWYWLIYPSHVPDHHSDFADVAFITGGMGTGPNSASPLFISDDRWLVHKPSHLGEGVYADIERRVYLPQWLQHEFFHHLYRVYPEFGLEAQSHQWFDRSTWPADFVGLYEPDYYHESLFKRLQGADTPMVAALRYATTGQVADLKSLPGFYQREPVDNEWHLGTIQLTPEMEWLNSAGVRWRLYDDLANGQVLTGPDCPYYGTWGGNRFFVVWQRNAFGDETDRLNGFSFNGEFYRKVTP